MSEGVLVLLSASKGLGVAIGLLLIREGLVCLGDADGGAAGAVASAAVAVLALVLLAARIRLILFTGVSSVEDSKDLDVVSSNLCHYGAEVLLVYGIEFEFKFPRRV